ncbi:serine/threonine protein kinase [Blastococcus sp. TF02-8]|nr:serine/threonine protein kinase [Blastococcus sp. TF02-8]
MGQVWRGRDTVLHRPVAVKVLRSEYTGDATFLARFRAEAQHTAALTHRNIAALFDYGEGSADGEHVAFLVMELVEGESLAQLLAREGRLDCERTLDVLGQAAAGLAAAHRAGLVHRDVKPGNLLVGTDGTVRITDFGIAWSAGSAPLTQTGQVVGTAHYLSPEQAAGEKAGPASDVYALGMIGYECLAGHRAFDGDNSVQIALRQLREVPAPLPGDVPEQARLLVDRALLKDPAERFGDGAAFRQAVEDVLAGRPLEPVERSGDTRPFTPAGAGRAPLRRRLVAPAAALLVGAALGVAVLRTQSDPPLAPTTAAEAPEPVVVRAEDVVGRPVDVVEAELVDRGMGVRREARESVDAVPGSVLAASPIGSLPPGTVVTLTYAVAGPAPAPAPTLPPVTEVAVPAPVPAPAPAPATAGDGGAAEPRGGGNGRGNGHGNGGNGNGGNGRG